MIMQYFVSNLLFIVIYCARWEKIEDNKTLSNLIYGVQGYANTSDLSKNNKILYLFSK